MTGILTPTSGKCTVNELDPNTNRKMNAQNIGVVFGQRTQLWWDLPLSESFTVLKEIYGVSDEDFKSRMEFLNEVLALNEFIHNSVRTLSLGQRMRADLAAALLHNPKVLYLDEPTIGLDLVVKDKIRRAIKEINKKYETTVILTTHDLGDIEELCNRIIIIDNGTLIYDGTVDELKNTYGTTRKVFIDVTDVHSVSEFNYNEIFSLNEKDLIAQCNNNTMQFIFNKDKISVSKIITHIMSQTEIKDIKIEETEISQIVKEIYQNGISEVLI